MSEIMPNRTIEYELGRLQPVSLDEISSARLMSRVEIKYLFPSCKLPELIHRLSGNYKVLQIMDRRILPYSTTYFDTAEYLFYYQHTRGELARHKVRYRQYEATGESFLEIKRRTNKGRTIKWRIENRLMDGQFDPDAAGFIREFLPVSPEKIYPALVNRFTRITLSGYDLMERITIDFNIGFSVPGEQLDISLPYLAVAELKKEAYASSTHFRNFLREMKIYPAGFSKYCVGNALLNDSLKRNAVKPKILFLNKLKNEFT